MFSRLRRAVSPLCKLFWPGVAAFLMVGLVLRWVSRDSLIGLSAIFYATPFPVLLLGFLVCAWHWRQRLGFCTVFLAAAALVSGYWLGANFRRQPPTRSSSPKAAAKVLFWNLNRPKAHPLTPLIELLAEHRPDFAAVVEAETDTPETPAAYTNKLPFLQVHRFRNHTLLFYPHDATVESADFRSIATSSFLAEATIRWKGQAWTILIADVVAVPYRSRKAALEAILQRATAQRHTILLGDFNTPWESARFDPFRQRLRHGWQSAGSGFRETWVFGLPILSIDHLWCSPDLEPISFELLWRVPTSDHACLLGEVAEL